MHICTLPGTYEAIKGMLVPRLALVTQLHSTLWRKVKQSNAKVDIKMKAINLYLLNETQLGILSILASITKLL